MKFQKISVLVPSFAHYVYAWMGWGQEVKPMILTKEKSVSLLSVCVHCCGVAGWGQCVVGGKYLLYIQEQRFTCTTCFSRANSVFDQMSLTVPQVFFWWFL